MVRRLILVITAVLCIPSHAHAGRLYMHATLAQYPGSNAATQRSVIINQMGNTCVEFPNDTVARTAYFPAFYPIDAPYWADNAGALSWGAESPYLNPLAAPFGVRAIIHKSSNESTNADMCMWTSVGILRAGYGPDGVAGSYAPDEYLFGPEDLLMYNPIAGLKTANDNVHVVNKALGAYTYSGVTGVPFSRGCNGIDIPYECCNGVGVADTGCTLRTASNGNVPAHLDSPILFKVFRSSNNAYSSSFGGPTVACTDASTATYCLDFLTILY